MRTVIMKANVYAFEELNGDARQKAIDDRRLLYLENGLHEDLLRELGNALDGDAREPFEMNYVLESGFSFDRKGLGNIPAVRKLLDGKLNGLEAAIVGKLIKAGCDFRSKHTQWGAMGTAEDVLIDYGPLEDVSYFQDKALEKARKIVGEWYAGVCESLFEKALMLENDDGWFARLIAQDGKEYTSDGEVFIG